MSTVTLKIEYSCDKSLIDVIKEYNHVLRFTYNRIFERPDLKRSEITSLQKGLNNCDLIKSHLRNSAVYDAKALVSRSKKPIVFGGKQLFEKLRNEKISKEEFKTKRLSPITSIGQANVKGNRLFKIIDNKTIEFRLDKDNHYTLNLQSVGKNRSKELDKLITLQNSKKVAITYKLDLKYVYIIFDYNAIKSYNYTIKKNCVIAIDMNPNSIGWSVTDWSSEDKYNVIQAGTFSLKPLNDYRNSKSVASTDDFHKYINNKRQHEVIDIAKQLFKLCAYYHCEVFSIEDLNIKARDSGFGRRFNRLVNNNWNRKLLVEQIRKHIDASPTILIECQPQYNSYIGNLVFRKERLPDECLASIEIGRRGIEFACQYIFNRRPHQKTVVYPRLESVKKTLTHSLEELGIAVSNSGRWGNILSGVKKSGVKYRFSASDAQLSHSEGLFSKFYKRRYLLVYRYL